jgi:hypothetical protein
MLTVTSAQSDNNTWSITRLNVKEQMTSIVYLLKVCDYTKQTPVVEFQDFWYGSFARNLSKCTLDNVGFNPKDNVVVEMTIPCQFESYINKQTVDNTLLNNTNYNDYNTEWTAYAIKNTNFNITAYKYRMIIIPKETPATFYGLASIGCYDDGCYSWYNTDKYVSNLFLHEMGHNFGLHHSRKMNDEYGDATCVMGSQPNRCWNAAHRYALGWSEPKDTLLLNNSELTLQKPIALTLGQFVTVNNNIFVEHVDISTVPNIIPRSIQVYQLINTDFSTLHLCSLFKVGDVCTINQDTQIALTIASMYSDTIIVDICRDACNNTSYNYSTTTPPVSSPVSSPMSSPRSSRWSRWSSPITSNSRRMFMMETSIINGAAIVAMSIISLILFA